MHDHDRGWEELYREQAVETMPWYYPDLDPDFKEALAELGVTSGRALDMGAGPGTQAIALAKMGFAVTATDISATAVAKAAAKAEESGLDIDWRRDDILHTRLNETFDYIFDRGLFHVLPIDERPAYVANVYGLLSEGGYLFLKCFSDKEPAGPGPHRLSRREIDETFGSRLKIVSMADSFFPGQRRPRPRALFVVMKRA